MKVTIVFAFAVEDGLEPVVGAAVYEVLARQIPRMVVNRMNGSGDRGIRFFPLMGNSDDGEREFFTIPHLLTAERLHELHGQADAVSFLVDGRIGKAGLTFRVHDATDLSERLVQTLAFDPLEPLPAVRRMLFELAGVLGWQGPPPELPEISNPALSYYFVAKDDLLGLEAGFHRDEDTQWLRAIAQAFDFAPANLDIQNLLLEICQRLVRAKTAPSEVAALLQHAVSRTDATGFVGRVAVILEDMGCSRESAALYETLVGETPESEAVATRIAGYLFRDERLAEACEYLERARARGLDGVRLLAQLSVLYQTLGQTEARRDIVDELATRQGLPTSVVRMVSSELVEQDRADAALALVEEGLTRHPDHPGLWLEKARALLYGPRPGDARAALDTALRHDPPPAIRQEVVRLRRFVRRPGILPALRRVDAALANDDLEQGLACVESMVREHPDIAESWLFLGVVRQKRGESAGAIEALRRAVDLDPDLGDAHNRLGILLVGAGALHEGAAYLERAIECLPEEPGPRIHMAQACFLRGDHEAGRAALSVASRLGASPETLASVRRAYLDDSAGDGAS